MCVNCSHLMMLCSLSKKKEWYCAQLMYLLFIYILIFFEQYKFLVLCWPLVYVMDTLDIDILLILLCCLVIFMWMDVNDWTSNTIIISGKFSDFCVSEIDSAICTCERWQYNILNCNEGIGYVYVLTFRVEFLFAHGFQSKSSIRPTSTCQLC